MCFISYIYCVYLFDNHLELIYWCHIYSTVTIFAIIIIININNQTSSSSNSDIVGLHNYGIIQFCSFIISIVCLPIAVTIPFLIYPIIIAIVVVGVFSCLVGFCLLVSFVSCAFLVHVQFAFAILQFVPSKRVCAYIFKIKFIY